MKTTVELPDELLAAARSFADLNGKTFKEVLVESLELFLGGSKEPTSPPGWESLFGAFPNISDVEAIKQTVGQEFSRIRIEDWE